MPLGKERNKTRQKEFTIVSLILQFKIRNEGNVMLTFIHCG